MSNYKCSLTEYIIRAWADTELDLDPKDYLYCENFEDLKDSVREDLADSLDWDNMYIKETDSDYSIPDEFYKEWKKLKGFNEKL